MEQNKKKTKQTKHIYNHNPFNKLEVLTNSPRPQAAADAMRAILVRTSPSAEDHFSTAISCRDPLFIITLGR